MTIKDVAKAAGVSNSTVSRYLNKGYVSGANKEKIQRAIDETGYQTNVFARGLKTNKSRLIAIILPRLDSFTAIQSLAGMNTVLSKEGYQMVVVPKNTIEEDELTYLRKITTQGFDGIIVMAHAITDEHIKIVESSKTPILFTGQSHTLAESITLDDYEIGSKVANYINTLDVQNVLYLSVSESDQSVGVLRKRGFLETLNKPVRTLITGFHQEDAYVIMKQESSNVKYDIVVGATDNIAIGAMSYLLEMNIKIPDDVCIMGIGNYDLAHFINPSLSTLDINYSVLGSNAAKRLLTHLEPDFKPDYQEINYQLIERNSTKKGLQF